MIGPVGRPQRWQRRAIVAGAGAGVFALCFWGAWRLFGYLALPLAERDAWASVISMFIAATGLVVTVVLGSRRKPRGLPADGPTTRHVRGLPKDLPRLGGDRLRRRAHSGDEYALSRLVDLLAEDDELGELRLLAAAGVRYAAVRLTDRLTALDDVDGLRELADAGDELASAHLGLVLARLGRRDELRDRAASGDEWAVRHLVELCSRQGRIDDALAAARLIELLVEHDLGHHLEEEVAAGTPGATHCLMAHLDDHGRTEQARRLRIDGRVAPD